MLKKNIKKLMAIIMILIIFIGNIQNIVLAKGIGDSAKLKKIGDCHTNIQFKFSSGWSDVKCHYIGYTDGGNTYPAYCISHGLDGVDELGSYSVDLTKILDDEKIYRVIINGFPYKSASQLGVEDDYDAYLATKQAVNCVMLGRDVRAVYRGNNSAGNKVVDAIYNLTQIGRNGSQTFSTPNINISRVGEVVESGNNFIQEFKVNSNIQMSNYDIVATANMPSGSYIADTSGNARTNFSAGNNFELVIPKSSMNKDINTTINITTKCKTYPVFFGKTTVSGSQNYAISSDPYGDYAGKTNLNVKTNTGVIKINKTDDETHKPIQGVTFQLLKEDGTIVANTTTNENGVATFSSLYRGKYILKETATNEKYILNTKEFEVDVEYNKTTTVDIENEHKKGNVKVYKIDKDNNRVVLGNVEFQLYSHEFEKVIGTYYTDVDGELLIKDLRIGDYSLIETKTNKWYNLADDTDVKIEWNLTKELQIENELKKGAIKIIKVDKDDNEVRLENVKFNVMDKDGNVLEQLTTDKNGEAQTSRYAIRDISELKIQETQTLDNYVLDNEVHTIVLEENQIKNVQFENEKIKGQIQITKVSKDDNKLTGEKKGTAIVGAEFEIYDIDNNLVDTVTTDDKGIALSKELLKGKYSIKETKAPKYYLVNQNTFNAEIINHKEIVNVDIEDESVDIKVEVEKTGFKETQSKDIIYYDFKNIKNNSNVYLDTFNWQDTLPTNALRLEKIFTGTWNQKLEYSVWYKTNLNDYRVIREDLDTEKNYEIDLTNIELQEGEYITDYEFRFGKVDIGFREVEKPRIYCKMLDDLKNGFTFTNTTKVYGTYLDKYVEDNDKWVTIIYNKDLQLTKLPRTGNEDSVLYVVAGGIIVINLIVLVRVTKKDKKNSDKK